MSKFSLTAQLQLQAPTNVGQVVSQIQNQLNSVSVNVNVAGGAKAQRQLQQINKQTKDLTDSAEQMGKTFGVSLKRFAAFSIATRAVGLFTAKLASAVDEAIDFQREMVKISQVTGKTLHQLKGLSDEIDFLATSLGVSSKSLLSVGRILAQAGIQAESLNVAITTLAKTTLAPTFDDITQTAEGAVAILAQFGQGVGALERQLGSINAVAGQFAVESGDLISVVRRTGGVFKAAGGDLNELIALFTSVRATTRESAESIATGLRTIFTRIQRPETIEYLKQYGVQLTDLNGKFVGPYNATKQLSEALSGLGEGDIRFVQIAEELGGFRQIGKVIPLLQKFAVSEAAYKAALAGEGSLDKDAATAKQALAVQITKVKEEFLALIRSISNTSSFQVFVKTSLQLASALIRIGEAVRPLIPLLAAFTAIKLAKGFGTFAKGIGASLGKNGGGKIHAFAAGGIVPGVGNTDTVPAMLSPGEFVIRKSSVGKIGAGNLAAMNSGGQVFEPQKFMFGDRVRALSAAKNPRPTAEFKKFLWDKGIGKSVSGAEKAFNGLDKDAQSRHISEFEGDDLAKERTNASNNALAAKKKEYPAGIFTTIPGAIAGFYLAPEQGKSLSKESRTDREFDLNGKKGVLLKGSSIAGYLPRIKNNIGEDNSSLNSLVESEVASALSSGMKAVVPKVDKFLDVTPIDSKKASLEAAIGRLTKDSNVLSTTSGFVFEGIIDALSGAALSGNQESFDFKKGAFNNPSVRSRIGEMFGVGDDPLKALVKSDAKKSTKEGSKIFNKIVSDLKKGHTDEEDGVRKFNMGGAAPSDTVPAVLTPGEFVVNAGAAKRIGYGNLNRMNKHGVSGFAKGGVVQGFKGGGSVTGKGTGADLAGLFALQAIPQIIQEMAGSTDKVNTATSRVVDSLSSMMTTTTALVFAMQAFGLQLTAGDIVKFFGTGQGSLRRIITRGVGRTKSLGRGIQGSKAGSAINGFGDRIRGAVGNSSVGRSFTSGRDGLYQLQNASSTQRAAFGAGRLFSKGKGFTKPFAGGAKALAGGAKALGSGVSSAAASVAGQLIKYAGPLAALAGGTAALNSLISAAFGYQQSYNKAIEEGNVAKAKELAVLQQVPGIIQLLDKPFGHVADAYTDFLASFGGSSAAALRANAEASALAAKATKNLEENAKLASETLKEVANGDISIFEAFKSGKISKNLKARTDTAKSVSKARGQTESDLRNTYAPAKLSSVENITRGLSLGGASIAAQAAAGLAGTSVTGILKELGSFVGASTSYAGEMAALDKADIESRKKVRAELEQMQPAFSTLASNLSMANGGTTTLQGFLDALDTTTRDALLKEGTAETQKIIDAQNKATQENLKYLKALSFGLRDASGQAQAVTGSMSRLVEAQSSGFNSFNQATQILEQSMTEAAVGMNPKDIESAQKTLASTLKSFGASDVEIEKAQTSLSGLNKAQGFASKALQSVAGDIKSGTKSTVIMENFRKTLSNELDAGGISGATKDSIVSALSNVDLNSDEIKNQIQSGNFAGVLQQAFGPLSEELKKQVLGPLQERGKQEAILIKLTQERIALEQNSIKIKQQAIDIEMEAADASREFGGQLVTAADRASAANRKLDLSLNGAGLRGVGQGTPQEVARAQQELLANFNKAQSEQNTAAANGGGAFANSEGVNNDPRARLQAAQEDLVKFARERISQIKEELSIIQKKNALEKSSLDSLLGGDIQSFFDKQASAGAASALRSGRSVSGSFSASALAGGFNSLKDQGLPPQQLQGIASAALRSLGIRDNRSAQMLSGNTREEQNANQLGRQFSSILGNGGDALGQISEMAVEAQNVVIQASGPVGIQNKNAEAQRLDAAQNRSTGGMIYASRGMFIPRGTDTVPAMLTPGEFVVNRAAVQRGNNLSMLKAMNGAGAAANNGGTQALSQGGAVKYYADGGQVGCGISSEMISQLSRAFARFSESVQSLSNMQIHVKLDATNINVNFNGTSFLSSLNSMVKDAVLEEVKNQIPRLSQNSAGEPTLSSSVLGIT